MTSSTVTMVFALINLDNVMDKYNATTWQMRQAVVCNSHFVILSFFLFSSMKFEHKPSV